MSTYRHHFALYVAHGWTDDAAHELALLEVARERSRT